MSTQHKRVIELSDRPWAARRIYQRFLGPYVMDPLTGIYFSVDASDKQKKLVVANFLKLPKQYQDLAREYGLTFSFSQFATANGNSSTFYADFSRQDRKKISPHVEMSESSLAPDSVLPHLSHELSHLWWRNLPQEARNRYVRFLRDSCGKGDVEITGYAQGYLEEYQQERTRRDASASVRRENCLKQWTEESFCESVAVILAPGYPEVLGNTTVDLRQRRQKMVEFTGLRLTA